MISVPAQFGPARRARRRSHMRLAISALVLAVFGSTLGLAPVAAVSSAPASQQFVAAAAIPYASDNFVRPAAGGAWGSAPVGGPYTYVGSPADFSLTGAAGLVTIRTPGATRAAYLVVSATDVDLSYQFSLNRLPTGGGSVYAYGSVRRSASVDYRVKTRISGTGAVYVSISQFSAGAEATLGGEFLVPGLTYLPGTDLKVHGQVSGTNPTTLVARLWSAAGSEPATWQVSRTDATPGLQAPGAVGLRAYTNSATTNTPINVAFDNFVAAPMAPMVAATVPNFSHVYVIVLENHERSAIIGNAAAPYINSLAAADGLASNYTAITHGSQPNYLALVSGSTNGVIDNDNHDLTAPTVFDQIETSGRTWQVAAENNPGSCFTGVSASGGEDGTGIYVRKHNPAISFTGISGDPTRCARITDLHAFDPANPANYTFIEPNLCHTMHDCSIQDGDTWLASFLPGILASPAYQAGGLILVTWDEGTTTIGGGGQVPTLVISPRGKPAFTSTVAHDHFSLLRTIQVAWGLPCLAETCTANDLGEFFQ